MSSLLDKRLMRITLTDRDGKEYIYNEDMWITAKGIMPQSYITSTAQVIIANINANERGVLLTQFAPYNNIIIDKNKKLGTIAIEFGRASTDLGLLFDGVIIDISLTPAPDFKIVININGRPSIHSPVVNRSYGTKATVLSIARQIVKDNNLVALVQNVKVDTLTSAVTVRGDLNAQLKILKELGDFTVWIINGKLHICDRGEPIDLTQDEILIEESNGMVGIPSPNANAGVNVVLQARSGLLPGSLYRVKSKLMPPANNVLSIVNVMSFSISSRDQDFIMYLKGTTAGEVKTQ